MDVEHRRVERRLALERQATGQQLVEQDAARVEVAPRVDVLEVALLGRHVRRRADERPGLRQARLRIGVALDLLLLGDEVGRDELGDPEVEDLHPFDFAAFGRRHDHDVLGLQIAVDDAEVVGDLERVAHFGEDPRRAGLTDRALALEQHVEIVADDELHRDVRHRLVQTPGQDLHRVRMDDEARRLGLALEAAHERPVARQLLVHDLEGDLARLAFLLGDPHGGHPAFAEEALDGVSAGDGAADERMRVGHREGQEYATDGRGGWRGLNHRVMRVRRATVDDARSIARVHVEAWRAAYRGLMPDTVLDAFTGVEGDPVSRSAALDASERRWRDNLVKMPAQGRTAVAERSGSVVGFVTAGPSRASPVLGEIWALYASPDTWGGGFGRALLDDALAFLATNHLADVELWVLEGNARAIRFYEAAGFRFDGATKDEEGLPHLRMLRPR